MAALAVTHSRAATYSELTFTKQWSPLITKVRSFAPTNGPLYAYSYNVDSNGSPNFVLAGKSDMVFAGQTVPTVTTLNGKTGTGVVCLVLKRYSPYVHWVYR